MTHSKTFSRREALFLIGAGVAAVIVIVTEQPTEAKKRGSRGSSSSKPKPKPAIEPQPPSQIPSSGETIRRNRVNIYPTAPAPIPQPLPAATLPGTCNAVRHPICNIVADDEGFSLWPVLFFGILGGIGWVANKLLSKLKEIIVAFANNIKGAASKKQRNKTGKTVNKTRAATSRNSSPKPKKPKKSQRPIDSAEVELDRLSADFGMAPNPEEPEWYVFRSGNAEGPYTKEQLRDVQKITARTSLRKEGEQDWVKAGTITELADFLNSKS
jgi:GYF domain 2